MLINSLISSLITGWVLNIRASPIAVDDPSTNFHPQLPTMTHGTTRQFCDNQGSPHDSYIVAAANGVSTGGVRCVSTLYAPVYTIDCGSANVLVTKDLEGSIGGVLGSCVQLIAAGQAAKIAGPGQRQCVTGARTDFLGSSIPEGSRNVIAWTKYNDNGQLYTAYDITTDNVSSSNNIAADQHKNVGAAMEPFDEDNAPLSTSYSACFVNHDAQRAVKIHIAFGHIPE